MHKETIGTE